MGRTIHLVATVALCLGPRLAAAQAAAAAPAAAEAATTASGTQPQWTSMSRARVTTAVPERSPMATDLTAQTPSTSVPLPPPPTVGGKPLAPSAPLATPAAIESAPGGAGGAKPGGPGEPKVKVGADQTGAMISVTQDLESDRIRQNWAATGGTIPAFEANGGMTLLYKDLSQLAGQGAYMSGVGFNFGGRVAILNLTAPKYDTRDRNWWAFKLGGGMDLDMLGITIYTPPVFVLGRQVGGGTQSASMTTMTLVGTAGFMYAFGSFDSPSDWSGMAIGAEWAPSYQSTSMTDSQSGTVTTNSSFNAGGFALNFESGSLQSMAAKMGKKAHMKVRVFFLPPVGEIPFMVTASVGAVWY